MNKHLSPSRIIKFLFPDKYADIPKWIMENAANFGKDMHKVFEIYLNNRSDLKNIEELLYSKEEQEIFYNFIRFIKKEKIIKPVIEKEFINKDLGLHGFIDLKTNSTFYDWKIRSTLKSKDNFLTEKIQMIIYDLILKQKKNWKLIIFNKKKNEIKIIEKKDIPDKEYQELINLIHITIKTMKEREKILWNYQQQKKRLKLN